MASRERYQVTGNTIEEISNTLNFVLQRIGDRLDKLEGIRGKPSLLTEGVDVVGNIEVKDEDEEIVHSLE